jgi:glycosyltransferase involved in cell wall biosynthesis
MKTPTVSIILCTFNRAGLLPRALDSVLSQTYSAWELIIVNDGSTDETVSIIEKYRKQDDRIRAIHQSNRGLSLSRNIAMEHASGEYFALIDDDDEYLPTHIEKRIEYFQNNPDVDIVWGGLDPQGPEERHYVLDMERPGQKIHLSDCFVSGTLFGKVSVFRALGGFRILDYAEDWDFVKRAREKYIIHQIYFPTYLYYIDAPHRLSDLYAEGKGEAIRRYREKGK